LTVHDSSISLSSGTTAFLFGSFLLRHQIYSFVLLCLCLLPILSGCTANSVLIQDKDPSFDLGQVYLKQTSEILAELKPPLEEQLLFSQAEGFYRYRFTPHGEGSALYLAEAAAAITEFPAFQSLAGTLSLQDLRYRSSDSAVQLWESLLKRYPKTTLKPLTLYRLGWAYRNVSSQGLPRDSPDDAFDQLIVTYPESSWAGQAKAAKQVPWKSKNIAASRSLVPGWGQLYLGQTRSGITRLSVAALSLAAILAPLREAAKRKGDLKWNRDRPVLLVGFLGLIALSFDYTNSYEEAMKGVVLYNEAQEDRFNRSSYSAP